MSVGFPLVDRSIIDAIKRQLEPQFGMIALNQDRRLALQQIQLIAFLHITQRRGIEQGDAFEIRALGYRDHPKQRPSTKAGYFDSISKAFETIRDVALASRQVHSGICVTLNPVIYDCRARCHNRLDFNIEKVTSDVDVAKRHWLFLDFDPQRPSGVSSREDELSSAKLVASATCRWLEQNYGFVSPLVTCSGNGFHLLYPIDLPHDDESERLIKSVLSAIAQHAKSIHRDGLPTVKVDEAVSNASRLIRIAGSLNRKGDSVPERPWRYSSIISIPPQMFRQDNWSVVSRDQLERLAAFPLMKDRSIPLPQSNSLIQFTESPAIGDGSPNIPQAHSGQRPRLDVERWLLASGYKVHQKKSKEDKTVYELDRCPFNPNHESGKAAIFQFNDGKLGAKCQHDSCSSYHWHEFKQAIGPPSPEQWEPPLKTSTSATLSVGQVVKAGDRNNFGRIESIHGETATVHFRSPEGKEATKSFSLSDLSPQGAPYSCHKNDESSIFTSRQLMEMDLTESYLVSGIIVAGQPAIIGGPQKALKTSVSLDLAIAIASGTPFLGKYDVPEPRNVLFMSSESGLSTLRSKAQAICRAQKVELSELERFLWSDTVPRIDDLDDVEQLEMTIVEYGIDVLFVDPLYFAMGGEQMTNLLGQGEKLRLIANLCSHLNVTLVLVHHFKKPWNDKGGGRFSPPTLEDLSGVGFAEFARQWLLVKPRRDADLSTGEFKLWMMYGGSSGHGGLLQLKINEGVFKQDEDWREWERQVAEEGSDEWESGRSRKPSDKNGSLAADALALLGVLRTVPDAELCATNLRTKTKLAPKRIEAALIELMQRGLIVEEEKKAGNNKRTSFYRIAPPGQSLEGDLAKISTGPLITFTDTPPENGRRF